MSSSSGRAAPRYAEDDPKLPKPWKGLVDGNTGYLYYWNPETNVTQYERPLPPEDQLPPPPPPLPPPPPRLPTTHSRDHRRDRDRDRDRDRRSRERERERTSRHRRDSSDDDDDNHLKRPHQSKPSNQGRGGRGGSADTTHGHGAKGLRELKSLPMSTQILGTAVGDEKSAKAYRLEHEITVIGENVPAPLTTFESSGFPSEILKEIERARFSSPTPIQAQSWPIAMEGNDIVAVAKTGSGKTLGYLLPGFLHVMERRAKNDPKVGPTVLVLAPTRELATQIVEEAQKFGRSSKISCTCLYGGAPKGPQLRDLDRGVDVVVATPGRLNDIIEMRRVSLKQVSYLVLDEADRMLDMGFEPQIWKIVKDLPYRRQTLMFTATWPKEVRRIAEALLVHPIQVNIGRVDQLEANQDITQHVEVITPMEKHRRLEQILRSQDRGSKVLIFCTTKRTCDQLARTLTRQFEAAAIHGDKTQSEREKVLNKFRTGSSPILVATDVAARGLDIKDIRVVINYDFPTGIEDYVHRIGRTGRAGASGLAYTFFCDQDSRYAGDLVKILEGANQQVPRELRVMVGRGGHGGKRRWRRVARDNGQSHAGLARDSGQSHAGLNDSSYGGRDSQALPASGKSEGARSGRGLNDYGSRDRYDYNESDGRGHKPVVKARGRSRSRSDSPRYSPTTKRARYNEVKTSRSRSPNKSRSPSRSRARSFRHGLSRSQIHSRSPSASNDIGQIATGSGMERPVSPYSKRENTPTIQPNSDPVESGHEPTEVLPLQDEEKVQLDRSPSPNDQMNNGTHSSSDSPRWQESSLRSRGNADPVDISDRAVSSPMVHRSKGGEEEEEGMIAADEDGEILPDDDIARSSRSNAAEKDDSHN